MHERLAASPRRAAFFCSAVAALDRQLRERGSRLIVRRGRAGPILKAIARATDSLGVAWSASYDRMGVQHDQRLQSELEEAGLRAMVVHDAPALPPEQTTAERRGGDGEGYRAFVPYFMVWRKLAVPSYDSPLLLRFAQMELQSEALPNCDEFQSHESAPLVGPNLATAQLRAFLHGPALQYSVAANVPADERTSRLSADLSFGTIAARTVVRETLKRCDDPFLLTEERASLRMFLRSLARRDFFLQLSWYHTADDEPLQAKMRGFTFARSHAGLNAWSLGETGYPLVDAGMRQLRETGWMHPRVRAIVASFLCFDLGVDWRVGYAQWEKLLIEDEPSLAIGNWQWVAGVGADLAAYPRIYNPRKQAGRFDPRGDYVRRWIPELSGLIGSRFTNSRRTSEQIELPFFNATVYPQPILDHEIAAREFLVRYSTHVAKER